MIAMINDVPINYVDLGNPSSMPVLFVHGFPFSHSMWKHQLNEVSRLYRAIAYDVRGHGESYVGDGLYTIEGHVDDLMALLDTLKVKKTVIVGLSMGGYITLRALERNPERFLAAVLCDTRSEADTNESKLRRFEGIENVKKDGAAPFADTFVKGVFAADTFKRSPEAVEDIRTVIARTTPLSIAGTLLALASRTDTTPSLSSIGVPTLILVGERDVTTPPSASEAMHAKIPQSEIYLIPGAAHMSNLENPKAFNERLLAFLQRVASTPR
jgi:3-oxoadipate enol-lactonase